MTGTNHNYKEELSPTPMLIGLIDQLRDQIMLANDNAFSIENSLHKMLNTTEDKGKAVQPIEYASDFAGCLQEAIDKLYETNLRSTASVHKLINLI